MTFDHRSALPLRIIASTRRRHCFSETRKLENEEIGNVNHVLAPLQSEKQVEQPESLIAHHAYPITNHPEVGDWNFSKATILGIRPPVTEVAVLSCLSKDGTATHRYYRARPTTLPVNPPTSHYDSSPVPSKRRISSFTPRKRQDEYNSGSVSRDWAEESGSQTWTARERIKTVSCVALSPDGRWLAAGESGYNPRVLLFATAEDASCEVPTSVVTDHNYGLRCVAFSPDMKYLATLGDYKDGFLFIWSFNSRTGQLTLHSTNKCTANICDMIFCGSNLFTVGTRCIRIWQIDEGTKQPPTRKPRYRLSEILPSSPGPAPLPGRNVLLGSMVDCTFTCIVSVNESNAIIGTDTGFICLVDIAQNVPELKVLKKLDLAVSSTAFIAAQNQLLMGTSLGLHREDLEQLCKQQTALRARPKAPRLSIRRSLGLLNETEKSVVAIASLANHTVSLDNDGSLQIRLNGQTDATESPPTFAAHKSIILGVQALPESAKQGSFFTYSKNGETKFWDINGTLLRQEHLALDPTNSDTDGCENEITRMRYFPSQDSLLAADRFGVFKLISSREWEAQRVIRAHSAEVTSIDIFEPGSLVATCSRDRMVQLFRIDAGTSQIELLQTMDEHTACVNEVQFAQQGTKLLSCSADRSLVVRERVQREEGGSNSIAYLTTKVLSLKSSPLCITMLTENVLAVSTMDRSITKVDVSAGTFLDSFKVGDSETSDTVFLNSVVCVPGLASTDGMRKMIIGHSSLDKSIRVYGEKLVTLLVREHGHTEGVSDIAVLEQPGNAMPGADVTFVSTGLDGTILIWRVSRAMTLPTTPGISQEQAFGVGLAGEEHDATKQSPASLPPMRRVLSKFEIADLTRANGQLTPSSPRSLSPIRLKRKTSRLALATSVEDVETAPSKVVETPPGSARSPNPLSIHHRRSPSPPVRAKLRSQRSRSELSKEMESKPKTPASRSQSPPPLPVPVPVTPKQRQKANNARLRRAPSVPSDLHSHAAAQAPRQSTGQAEFGSLAMATDQATRMIKIYRKKLVNSKETVSLDSLEYEVLDLLKTIRATKDKTIEQRKAQSAISEEPVISGVDGAVNQLAGLLEVSKLTDSPPSAMAMPPENNGSMVSATS
ncbi:hypothetical protein H2200_002858 [Cladophialophora chaetospira]|uniref:WD repeat protein n=1 Tax=Cladophialophora chaetospira TaxID=386627 RepID=A0AA38XGC6_9EURO|nr:hypothetical protein H2200_002858 [Cladophialophora chaetospira]